MSQFKLEDADVLIDLANQTLTLPKHNKFYVISTGKNGIGEQENTGKTPRGWHRVAKKIGAESPQNAVFIARKPTGEVYNAELAAQFPERDWILSRILWLDGLEEGFNKGEDHDTMQRYIYIHGTPDTQPMGVPMSHGCVRMRNEEIIELFDLVVEDALVYLSEQSLT
ncbi:cell wall-recycling L,D-carboxypeptidase ElsL [Acinetobacter pittii]|uniref:cell wall-recycling L,D-carboxypeptidase ElsL n=1 Tax=Acinetobacter pittii TaxID=48296 RepID=UPI001EFE4FA6|nr:cell wall-recycling L,D-carboxypeptidase ElsL [Acinetobacter pittii]MCG9514444.1 L,D-transpeptidase [Acinetobacter pittii]MDX8239396.1 cell wall-recycling L,D-carboxypeptidase ElsL [Acinetobacter pittii]WPP70679.1 cell wall-recycling L,D-carboxypeptidase ElsL [Acinetobacter pittii]